MQMKAVERRLSDGGVYWETVVVDEDTGGSQPAFGFYAGATPETIPADVFTRLTWALGSGEALLDLSTPDLPTFIASGVYAVSAYVSQISNATGMMLAFLAIDTYYVKGSATLSPTAETVIEAEIAVTFIGVANAGSSVEVKVLQESGDDLDVQLGGATVVKIA